MKDAEADAEIAKARARARLEEQKADIMVEAEIEALRKKTEATGTKDKVILEAEAEAEAILKRAKAAAEGKKLDLLAQAEGEKALAEAQRLRVAAETAHLAALTEAGTDRDVQIAWVLRDEYTKMIGADAEKWKHINLGEVKVIGDSNMAASFMGNVMKAVESARSIGVPGMNGVLNKLVSYDNKNQQETSEKKDEDEFETV